jgi:hypothetical protein
MILFWTAVAAVAAALSALFAAIYTGVTFRLLRTQSGRRLSFTSFTILTALRSS